MSPSSEMADVERLVDELLMLALTNGSHALARAMPVSKMS